VYRVKQLVCAIAVWGLLVGSALAQGPVDTTAEQQREYDATFQEMLNNPAILDILFKFATIATKTGDYEGAISALERMLLINPDLPRVRLELGVLYYRLGSYEVARTYFEAVLASASLTPEVRARTEQFMAEIEKRQSRSRFAGEAFGGVRYQSNANLGPPTSSVRLFGQTANLNASSVGTPDWGLVSSGFLRHTYDFGNQDLGVLETQLTGYANRQFHVSQANVSILDLTSGPRFRAFAGYFEDISIKPFLTAGYIWVNDTSYYGAWGSGVEVGALLTERLRNTTLFLGRRQAHPNTWFLPTNDQFNGWEYSANTTFSYQLTEIVQLFTNGNVQRYLTDSTPWQNYQLLGAGGGMQFRFTDPAFKTGLPWSVGLSVNVQWWTYDQPDAIVDPTVNRLQTDVIVNVTLAIPFDERTTLTTSVGRFARTASIPNYEFTNNSFLMGVSWRF